MTDDVSSSHYRLARRPLLTPNEQRAEGILSAIGEHHGFRIDSQVKLSAVIYERPPGLTARQWDYATRATFDFVVSNAETLIPDFAVELDDNTHRRPDVGRRDQMKDDICEKAEFELLRIEAQHLRPGPRGRRLLEYLIDARAHSQNIYQLQQQGYLPQDEFFDYPLTGVSVEDGYVDFANNLAGPAVRAVWEAHEGGILEDGLIQTQAFDWRCGWSEGWAWVRARGDLLLFATARVRSFPIFFAGITPDELTTHLSADAIREQLGAFKRNEAVLVKASDIGSRWAHVRARRQYLRHPGFLDHLHWRRR
jgi:Protein of unknown function (DUF2726)